MPDSSDEILNLYYDDYAKIPDYQREFAWDAALATQLFDSFNQFLIANPQIAGPAGGFVGPAAVAPPINRFYLGTIITVDQNPIPIVDGQQRLTSIAIMASILRDYCIEAGEYNQAYELDRKFCWKKGENVGRSNYSNGKPKVELRDTGTGIFNLQENMFNICSLKLEPDPPITYQITNIGAGPGRRNITIDQDLIWEILEDHQIEMNTGTTITVARTAPIGVPMFQVSAADAGLLTVGDTFDLSYGNKIGNAPKGSTYIGKARNKLIETIAENLDAYYGGGGGAPALHLPNLEAYVAQWIALIENTDITQIQFDDAGSAMEYFLIVNDKTLEKTLTNLDRLRAQVKIVIEGNCQVILPAAAALIPNPIGVVGAALAAMTDEQKLSMCMRQDFDTIEEILLNRRGKSSKFSEDFFYDFYQVYCPLKGLEGNIRPNDKSQMPQINRQYLATMIDVDGNWNKVDFQKFTTEIRQFAGIYCRARDRWSQARPAGAVVDYFSDVSTTDPYQPEICERTEEVWLRILANMGSRKQFRPTYMAGSYVIRRELQAGNITTGEYTQLANTLYRSLLKMHIALQILPKAAGEESKTPGDIYGYSDNFIPTITGIPVGSNFAFINPIFTAISTTINGEIVAYPPIDAAGIRLPLDMKNNPDVKPILMLAEWQQSAAPGAAAIGGVAGALVAGAAGALIAAIHFHDGPRNYVNEVEHIQPKNLQGAWPVIPKGKPRKGAPLPNLNGYTAPDEDTWVGNRDRLGNRLLCKRDVNNHAEDRALDWKISNVGLPGPVCPKNPIPPPPALPNYGNCTGTSKHYRGDGRAIVNKWLGAYGVGGWLMPAAAPAIATPPLWWGDVEIEKWEKEIIDLLILILP